MERLEKTRVDVFIGRNGVLVGRLHFENSRGRQYSTFNYSESWLENPSSFALAPSVSLKESNHYYDGEEPLPPFLSDTLPDLWGRKVIRHYELKRKMAGEYGRDEIFYLLNVSDFYRQGALRLKLTDTGGLFLAVERNELFPDLKALKEFSAEAGRIETGADEVGLWAEFIGPGTSLGGARPKCSILDSSGNLCLAKFTSDRDTISVQRAEALVMALAKAGGLTVPDFSLLEGHRDRPILLIERFDRQGDRRIPYISARTMLDAIRFPDRNTYADLGEAIRENCVEPKSGLNDLFARIAFSILVTNVDDHLKNHGFLYAGNGQWRLSPIFDVNAFPNSFRRLSTPISALSGNLASLETLVETSYFFDLGKDEAMAVIRGLAETIAGSWRNLAGKYGMTQDEIENYRPAFEHQESNFALGRTNP